MPYALCPKCNLEYRWRNKRGYSLATQPHSCGTPGVWPARRYIRQRQRWEWTPRALVQLAVYYQKPDRSLAWAPSEDESLESCEQMPAELELDPNMP